MRRLFHVLKLPLSLVALASTAKSFRDNSLIGSRWLNRCGLHVVRVALAHGVMRWRRLWFAPWLAGEERRRFARDGFIVVPDFLPAADFAALQVELRACAVASSSELQGDTRTRRVLLDRAVQRAMPACREVLRSRRYRRLCRYVAGRARIPSQWLQRIDSGVAPGERDPQRDLHSDTFHPTMKSWLFLDDVDERNGPFTYVPGSQRLTFRRLVWEYRQSLHAARLPLIYSARGSLRIAEDELHALGLPPPVAVKCRSNTLVVADTRGFHRRGDAEAGSTRSEIWSMSRTNPFNPLPGLPLPWFDDVDRAGLVIFLRLRERYRRAGAMNR